MHRGIITQSKTAQDRIVKRMDSPGSAQLRTSRQYDARFLSLAHCGPSRYARYWSLPAHTWLGGHPHPPPLPVLRESPHPLVRVFRRAATANAMAAAMARTIAMIGNLSARNAAPAPDRAPAAIRTGMAQQATQAIPARTPRPVPLLEVVFTD